jgi:hypothetical protein
VGCDAVPFGIVTTYTASFTRRLESSAAKYVMEDHGFRVISGFRRDYDEIYSLLEYYAASNGNALPTFRDNVAVPSSRIMTSKKKIFLDT